MQYMKIKFQLILGFMLILCDLTHSQNPGDISFNEIMYAPSTLSNECFKIYNNTATLFNMANWKWKDAT